MRWIVRLIILLAAVGGAGCARNAVKTADAGHDGMKLVANPGLDGGKGLDASIDTKDAPKAVQLLIYLDVYQICVPWGTVSGNEEFWKRIDEDAIDIATRDVLYRNGVRAGVAPSAEWGYFKEIIDRNPAMAVKLTEVATDAHDLELKVKTDLQEEDIFYFNSSDELIGRSYDACQNILMLTFGPAPRKLGTVRVALSPLVRTNRRHLSFNVLQSGSEIAWVNPEHLYDMGLRADVPLDHFLIVAPSPEAKVRTSVGQAFFTKESGAEKQEALLLLVPRPYRMEGDPIPGK